MDGNIILDRIYSLGEYIRMKLDAYITQNRLTECEVARRASCSQSTINKVRNGIGNPTFDLLRRISEATGGEFQPADFTPTQSGVSKSGEAA